MTIKRSELDAAIAVEVMGWDRHLRNSGIYVNADMVDKVMVNVDFHSVNRWRPSTNANHALKALETLCSKRTVGYSINTLFHEGKDEREVCIESDTDDSLIGMAEHESLAIAICLALLSAVRGEQVTLEDEG